MATTILATLQNSETCEANGIIVRDPAPVLALCRALVDAGHDPSLPLHAYRGDMIALKVRSIGEGAHLCVAGNGVGFRYPCAMVGAPPARQSQVAATGRAASC